MKKESIHNGIKKVTCDSLGEFFSEFKKYRDTKSDIANKENCGLYTYWMFDTRRDEKNKVELITSMNLVLKNRELRKGTEMKLVLDLSRISNPIKFSEIDYWQEKIGEILGKIWEKGSADTSFFEAEWQRIKGENPEPEKNPSSSPTNSPDKENKIVWWIGGGIIFILAVSFVVFLLRRGKKIKK